MEQYGKGGRTDAREDFYALAATFYMMLTATEPIESIERTLGAQLTPPREINPIITEETQQAILQAMALLPGDRFLSVEQFKATLPIPIPSKKVTIPQPAVITPSQPAPVASPTGNPMVAEPVSQPVIASFPVYLKPTPVLAHPVAMAPQPAVTSLSTVQLPAAEQLEIPPERQKKPSSANGFIPGWHPAGCHL